MTEFPANGTKVNFDGVDFIFDREARFGPHWIPEPRALAYSVKVELSARTGKPIGDREVGDHAPSGYRVGGLGYRTLDKAIRDAVRRKRLDIEAARADVAAYDAAVKANRLTVDEMFADIEADRRIAERDREQRARSVDSGNSDHYGP